MQLLRILGRSRFLEMIPWWWGFFIPKTVFQYDIPLWPTWPLVRNARAYRTIVHLVYTTSAPKKQNSVSSKLFPPSNWDCTATRRRSYDRTPYRSERIGPGACTGKTRQSGHWTVDYQHSRLKMRQSAANNQPR
jgi:hypothetical protein